MAADAGLSVTAIRRFSQAEQDEAPLLGRLLTLNLCLALPFLFIPILLFMLVYGRPEPLLVVLWPVIAGGLISGTVASLCQARFRMPALVPASAVGAATTATLVSVALATKQLVVVAGGLALGAIAEATAALVVGRRLVTSQWPFTLRGTRRLLIESLPVLIGGTCVVLYQRFDTLLVGKWLGQVAVGQYAAAYRLTEPLLLVLSSLALSAYASFSRAAGRGGWQAADEQLRSFLVPLGVVLAGGCLVLSLASRPIVMGLYGTAYGESVVPLRVLAWSVFLKGLNGMFTAAINARGAYSVVTAIACANLVANVVLNAFLMLRLGIGGAAVAVVGTEALGFALQLAYLRRVRAA